MENTNSQYELANHATVTGIIEKDGMVQSFAIMTPPSQKQPEGSKLTFDLTEYSRLAKANSASDEKLDISTINKALREDVLDSAKFLADNVPAFTTLLASISASGVVAFKLRNPDASRFGIIEIPGITQYEVNGKDKIKSDHPVIIEGNLDKLDDFSQIGYESMPKSYQDNQGAVKDFRPKIMLLQQLAMASKDLQTWPLPLSYEGNKFSRNQTIHNVMNARFFAEEAVDFNDEDVLRLNDLKSGAIPRKLQNKGYPEPELIEIIEIQQPEIDRQEPPEIMNGIHTAANKVKNDMIIRDQIAINLKNHLSEKDTFVIPDKQEYESLSV